MIDKRTNPPTTLLFTGFMALLLIAYTWISPFRDIFGLETRNALMSREMLENGFSVIPTALGLPYPDYPPLYFWLSTLFSMPVAKVSTFSIVIPSALAAIMTVGITFMAGRRIHSRIGWLAALVLATFPEFWTKAGEGNIDMLLAFTVTASLFLFFIWDNSDSTKNKIPALTGALCFVLAAFFTKGPIGIVLPAAAWGGYLLTTGRFRSFFIFVLLIAIVAMGCLSLELFLVWKQGGMKLVHDVIHMQVTGRFGGKANHPFYYYLLCLLQNTALWLIIGLLCLRRQAERKGLTFQHPLLRLSIVWFIVTLIIFTLASTRHGRYLLPLYPPLALLVATCLNYIIEKKKCPAGKTAISISYFFIVALLTAGAGYALFYQDKLYIPASYLIIWATGACLTLMYIHKKVVHNTRLIALFLLILATALSGVNMLITPESSRKSSGRRFVQAAETTLSPDLKVIICGINPDGDGVKFAFYSRRKPASLQFIPSLENLKKIPGPFLLVMRDTKVNRLNLKTIFEADQITMAADGSIRSHPVIAYLIS